MARGARKPVIALVMGDAAGIGPELAIRSATNSHLTASATLLVIGSLGVLHRAAETLGERAAFSPVESVDAGRLAAEKIPVLHCEVEPLPDLCWGVSDRINGANAVAQIRKAVELATTQTVDGVVIAPLNKEAMHKAGFEFPDEIAFLGSLANRQVRSVVTWRNIFRLSVTGHVALREVADLVTQARIVPAIKSLWETMGRLGVTPRKIGVAALNPHAGEGGAFGDEEIREIEPAIESAREMGISVNGPYPADTIFVRAMRGEFNGVVFLYHDQGNTAMKSVAFGKGVLLYDGLPFPCAGPTHGSAYEIAGKGKADPSCLEEAIEMVCRLSRRMPGARTAGKETAT
jgi:4-hydroxythreonine-4-phosphate dehydrogenase